MNRNFQTKNVFLRRDSQDKNIFYNPRESVLDNSTDFIDDKIFSSKNKTNYYMKYNDECFETDIFSSRNDQDTNFKNNQMKFDSYKTFTDFVEGKKQSKENEFNPYSDNSGTTLSLKIEDCIIVAADTRHSGQYCIESRKSTKIFRINEYLMTVTGFFADGQELYNRLMYEVRLFETYEKMNIHNLANLASKILYSKRFFPYYTDITICGIYEGQSFIYEFDCVGSYGEVSCICKGSGAPLIQPLLDSFINKKNWNCEAPTLDKDSVLKLVLKAFDSAAERDVKTGDYLEVYILNGKEFTRDFVALRKD